MEAEAAASDAGSSSGLLIGAKYVGEKHKQMGEFTVRFWGVRGSYPVSGLATQRVGGNTSCLEIRAGGHEIILDGGTGLIALGQWLRQHQDGLAPTVTILFSHLHYDHILGLPFFDPLYQSGATLYLAGPRMGDKSFCESICAAITSPYFPVDLREVPSTCIFYTLESGDGLCWHPGVPAPRIERAGASIAQGRRAVQPGEVRISFLHTVAHPRNGCLLSRIEYGGRSLVYATDVEDPLAGDRRLIGFARGADVLIHDAQYTQQDYATSKRGFGHSTPQMAAAVARAAGVKQLVLFHHDPAYDDALLERVLGEAQGEFSNTMLACEGLELSLPRASAKVPAFKHGDEAPPVRA